MVVLFLDDDIKRIQSFKSYVPFANVRQHAHQVIDFIKNSTKIDQLYLDHDLDGQMYVNSNAANTGMEVVRWIVQNKPSIENIIIHSHNPEAAKLMKMTLNNAGYSARLFRFHKLVKHFYDTWVKISHPEYVKG